MKIIKVIFISIGVLIVLLLIGIFIFLKKFDVNQYLPKITKQIGQTINRKVSIDHANLGFGIFSGLSLDLKNLAISDDPYFSNVNFLTVDQIHLRLDLITLLAKREINVVEVLVISPKVSIIRSQDGKINAQTMAPASGASLEATKPKQEQSTIVTTTSVSSSMAVPAFAVKSIHILNGQFSLEDQNIQMPLHVLIQDVDVRVNSFSLSEPFDFILGLNAWSKAKGLKNVEVTGRCRVDLSKASVQVMDFRITSDLSRWDLNKVKKATPMLDNIPIWPLEIKGNVLFQIPQMNASAKGVDNLSANLSLNGGYVKLKELHSPVENISVQVESDLKNLSIKQVQAHIGTGELNGKGDVKALLTAPTYNFHLESRAIKIEELIDESAFPALLKGSNVGEFTGAGEGFAPEAMLNNIKGEGEFNINDGKIEKLNVLKTILDKLNFVPGLGSSLAGALPSDIKDKLDTDTTVLDKAYTKVKVGEKVVTLDATEVESKIFSIASQGTVGFDLNTNIEVKTYLAADLSSALVKKAKPLQGLLDESNRIFIPGRVSGVIPSISYFPQIDYITKKVATSAGTQEIGKQLQKVLDKNPGVKSILNSFLGGGQNQGNDSDSSTSNSSGEQSTNSDAQTQDQPANKLINNVLKNILR
ncbi:MAG: AsmA family protein [Candidatus Omnitrophota bacterium]